jgi:hypothetical protein
VSAKKFRYDADRLSFQPVDKFLLYAAINPPGRKCRSIDWLIKRLIKVGARVSYHARRWYVHIASAFPLAHHYRAVLA